MIDLHCHILPGLDDGASTIEESLQIARTAQKNGVKLIFATPHVMKGSYYSTTTEISGMVDELRLALAKASVDVSLFPGSEIYPEPTLPEEYKAGRLTTLGGTRFVLIEAPSSELPPLFETFIFRLAVAGALPVLAHPERNPSLCQDTDRLSTLVERGVILQVNAPSFQGAYGRRAQAAAEKMAKLGIIGFLGSDAHDERGGAGMKEARNRVQRLGGSDAIELLESNESRLLASLAKVSAAQANAEH